MACQGFAGVMSCDCFDECAAAMGRGSVHHKVCFVPSVDLLARNATMLSDAPANLSDVRFFARKRMRMHVRLVGWEEVALQD
eukprot:1513761-Prymnesium_polylepis.1